MSALFHVLFHPEIAASYCVSGGIVADSKELVTCRLWCPRLLVMFRLNFHIQKYELRTYCIVFRTTVFE